MFEIFGIALWVFAVLVIAVIAAFVAVEHESPLGATVALVVSGLVLHYSGTVNMLTVVHDWKQLLLFVGLYFGIGLAWAVVKWKFWVDGWARQEREAISEARAKFIKLMGIKGTTVPDEHKELFKTWSTGGEAIWKLTEKEPRLTEGAGRLVSTDAGAALSVKANKSRLVLWGVYWPFSTIWTLIDDPLRRAYEFVLTVVIGGVLQSFSNRAVASVERELSK
jgi:hypothetical protein